MLGELDSVQVCELQDEWVFRETENTPPEFELLRAILHRSILDLTDSSREVRREARAFFLRAQSKPYDVFSLPWIAEYLSIDFRAVVRRLEALGLLSEKTKNPLFRYRTKTRGKRVR